MHMLIFVIASHVTSMGAKYWSKIAMGVEGAKCANSANVAQGARGINGAEGAQSAQGAESAKGCYVSPTRR